MKTAEVIIRERFSTPDGLPMSFSFNQMAAAMEAYAAQFQQLWQNMDSAPKDETRILLCLEISKYPIICAGMYVNGRWLERWEMTEVKPILWMPITPPIQKP